jgi:hypothetical protein
MPKNPIDAFLDSIAKGQEVHGKLEQVRHTLDRIDPLETISSTVNDFSDKINALDAAFAKTKRRTRRAPPKQQQP